MKGEDKKEKSPLHYVSPYKRNIEIQEVAMKIHHILSDFWRYLWHELFRWNILL